MPAASNTLDITIGTTRTVRFTVEQKDLTTGDKNPVDITGAYLYLEFRREEGTPKIHSLDNDPGGENTGITIVDAANGVFDAKIPHTAFITESPGVDLIWGALVRLDPTGADTDRFEIGRGTAKLRAVRITIP